MTQLAAKTAENLRKIRESKPLIHNITNFVVMNTTANVLLACGASPVMAHADNEVEEMVDHAQALVLNIGTLTDAWVTTMIKAGRKASELGKPIILDPVGAGATNLRTNAVKAILAQTWVSVIRGNASEILAIAGAGNAAKGVDATNSVTEATETAANLARELGTTLAITGESDLVTDGRRSLRIEGGHSLMPMVTGTGCSARMAVLHARGVLRTGDRFIGRSIIGSEFHCRIEDTTTVGHLAAIVPSISGRAWITGTHQLMLDPSDPWPSGYRLADTWPQLDPHQP